MKCGFERKIIMVREERVHRYGINYKDERERERERKMIQSPKRGRGK